MPAWPPARLAGRDWLKQRERCAHPGINVASFGTALHVSAASAAELDAALAPLRARGLRITPVDTSLEDVFIALMQQSQDNFPS